MSTLPSEVDPIPSPVRDLVALFASALAGVQFPGVDDAALASDARAVEEAHAEVLRLSAALDEARALLDARKEALVARAHRAHGYARVFAEDHEEVAARLDSIVLPRQRARTGPLALVERPRDAAAERVDARDKGRRARRGKADAQLFVEAGAEAGAPGGPASVEGAVDVLAVDERIRA